MKDGNGETPFWLGGKFEKIERADGNGNMQEQRQTFFTWPHYLLLAFRYWRFRYRTYYADIPLDLLSRELIQYMELVMMTEFQRTSAIGQRRKAATVSRDTRLPIRTRAETECGS